MWDPETDPALAENYGLGNVLEHKMANKRALQRELGLEEDESKFVIGLISRLTNQKGLMFFNRKPFEMDMSVEFTTDNLLVKGYQRYVPTYYDWRAAWGTFPTS